MADEPTWAGTVPAEQLWSAWEWFMDRAVPVAEKAGVRLALQPDDPPIAEVRGIARIMNSIESRGRSAPITFRRSRASRTTTLRTHGSDGCTPSATFSGSEQPRATTQRGSETG